MMLRTARVGSRAAIAAGLVSIVIAVQVAAPRARASGSPPARACAALADLNLLGIPDAPTSIVSADTVGGPEGTPGYFDVVGVVQPQVLFRLRLPLDAWNGRYFQTGCGGLCGAVHIDACDDAAQVMRDERAHVGWPDRLARVLLASESKPVQD
jgi:feruloyl esterase